MIASYMNDTSGDARDRNAVAHRLFTTAALLDPVAENDVGLRTVCDHLFSLVGSSTGDSRTRASGYLLLNSVLSTSSTKNGKLLSDGRMSVFLDRLPTLYETLEAEEVEPFVALFATLLRTDILSTALQRNLPKLISRISRILRSSSDPAGVGGGGGGGGGGITGVSRHRVLAGLTVCTAIARSSYQNLLQPAVNSLLATCVDALDIASVCAEAAELFAVCLALDTPDAWTGAWVVLTEQLNVLLQIYLGVSTGYVAVATSGNTDLPEASRDRVLSMRKAFAHLLGQVRPDLKGNAENGVMGGGCAQALHVEVIFRSCCATLQHMLRCGCAGGAAAIDLSAFLPLTSAVVSLRLTSAASNADPKALIHNEAGVALADMALVAPQLKIAVLDVCAELFGSQQPGLFKVAGALCRPLASLLSSSELKPGADGMQRTHVGVSRAAVRAAGRAAACVPTALVAAAGGAAVQALTSLLESEVDAFTTPASGITNTSGSAAGPTSVLLTLELLVLFVGPMLPPACQDDIERAVHRALRCMAQGVIAHTVPSKHLNRDNTCALLRCSPHLQELCLRLASAEVSYCHHHGMRSGNAAVLLQAAHACVRQGISDTGGVSLEAARALSLAETLLNPALPPLSFGDESSRGAGNNKNSSSIASSHDRGAHSDTMLFQATVGKVRGSGSEEHVDVSAKRARVQRSGGDEGAGEEEEVDAEEEEEEEEEVDAEEAEAEEEQGGSAEEEEAGTDDDDDFQLPDIDMEEDPDK